MTVSSSSASSDPQCSLMQMFTGYHRDAYWEVVVDRKKSEKLKAKQKEAIVEEKSDLKSSSKVKQDQTAKASDAEQKKTKASDAAQKKTKDVGKLDLEKGEASATEIPTPEDSLDTPKKKNITSSNKSSPEPQDIINPPVDLAEEDKSVTKTRTEEMV